MRLKAKSFALPSNAPSKMHCEKDLACQHCVCWANHQKQCKIMTDQRNAAMHKLMEKNTFLAALNKKLNQELNKFRHQVKSVGDPTEVQERIRMILKIEIEQFFKADLVMKDHKIGQLNAETEALKNQVANLNGRLNSLASLNAELEDRVRNCDYIQNELKSKEKELEELKTSSTEMSERLANIVDAFKQKTASVTRFTQLIKEMESSYKREKCRAEQLDYEQRLAKAESKNKAAQINSLKSIIDLQGDDISHLETTATKLTDLVKTMDSEMMFLKHDSESLRERYLSATEEATLNEVQVRTLKQNLHLLLRNS